MNRLSSDSERQAHDAVQYLRALLLIEDRMKFESSVIRRTPTHWIARPTFESINWDLVRRTSAGKLWAVGSRLKRGWKTYRN
jgi:hypothetical protein